MRVKNCRSFTQFCTHSVSIVKIGCCKLLTMATHANRSKKKFKAGPPLEAILVIFGRRALIFFVWKLLEKNEKWHHFCAHAQWWSPWRRKNVEKGHLASSNLTFLLRGAWSDRDTNDIFAHCSLIFYFLDLKFSNFVCPSELYPLIWFFF